MTHKSKASFTQSHALLPIPTADTFGACSALFELGGMIVIHDSSGCNSTYTTHDEPRWYSQDSLLFISALTEYDAILGRDDKLIADIEQAAREFHPAFICILPSQIAHLIATDLIAISHIIERDTRIPTFTLPTNSMHPYDKGIEYALEHLANHLVEISSKQNRRTIIPSRSQSSPRPTATTNAPSRPRLPRVNLLGLTPLDYHWQRALPTLKAFLASHHLAFASSLTLSMTLAAIEQNAPTADVNLVLTASALPAAKILETALHIPYVAAVPYPPIADEIAAALYQATKDKKSRILYGNGEPEPPSQPHSSEPSPPTSASPPAASGPVKSPLETSRLWKGGCHTSLFLQQQAMPSGKATLTSRYHSQLREGGGFQKETFSCKVTEKNDIPRCEPQTAKSNASSGRVSVVSVESPRPTATTNPPSRPHPQNLLLTEPLASRSLRAALSLCGHPFTLLPPPASEPAFISQLQTAALLLSDPLYFPLAPAATRTIPLPRRAISGRTFEKKERNLLDQAEWAALLKELQP